MVVRLTVKLADMVNGVDLSLYKEGDVLDLPIREANMMIAERWAELVEREPEVRARSKVDGEVRAIAADRGRVRADR